MQSPLLRHILDVISLGYLLPLLDDILHHEIQALCKPRILKLAGKDKLKVAVCLLHLLRSRP